MRGPLFRRWGVPITTLLGAILVVGCGFQEPALQPITRENPTRIAIPFDNQLTASMDAMLVDPATRTLYLSDATNPSDQGVDVFDVSTVPGRYVKQISTGDTLPNGLVIAPDVHRLYTGNDDGTVSVIDIDPTSKTYQTIIATLDMNGKGASDLLDYDPKDHLVFVTNPDDGFMSEIDSRTDTVVRRVSNLDLIEGPTYDAANGMVYVGAVDDNLMYEINPRTGTVVQRFAFSVPCEPHGIAINPHTNQGIIGCADKDEPVTISWDFGSGQMIRTFDLAGAGDLAMYDATTNHFLFAAASFAPAEMAIFSGSSPISYLTAVPTSHKSHGVAYDDVHKLIYTYDGMLRQAGLWEFPDPAAYCDAQLKHCRVEP